MSVPYNTVAKIFQSNCRQTTKEYVPARSMWLKRVFSDLAITEKRHCLTIVCSGVNKNGPGRYRTQANDPEKQVCYFNKPRDNDLYNFFISNKIKTEHLCNGICLEVDRVHDKDETFDAEKTLKRDGAYDRFSKFDTDSEQPEFNGRGRKRGNEKISEHSIGRNRIHRK